MDAQAVNRQNLASGYTEVNTNLGGQSIQFKKNHVILGQEAQITSQCSLNPHVRLLRSSGEHAATIPLCTAVYQPIILRIKS